MSVTLGIAAGVAVSVLLRYITGWPSPVGRDDAAGLAVALLIAYVSEYLHDRRYRRLVETTAEDIRAIVAGRR